jgi:catechol 2,3-dioxygenase
MNQFNRVKGLPLPTGTQVRHVRLQVSDLANALAFYEGLLGFRQAHRNGSAVALSATGQRPVAIVLVERLGALPKPPRTTGLYHLAIRLPSRRALATVLVRLLEHNWPFQGFADHLVSEALYLADPDGNGLELYADRSPDHWARRNGQIVMGTEPLDVQNLVAEAAGDPAPWGGIDPDADIGHVHLHVSDLARAETFYHDLLGLDVTQRGYPGALFLSAGGYHHHLGINTWAGAGAPPPPPEAVGLLAFALQIPDGDAWRAVLARLAASGMAPEVQRECLDERSALIRDPDGLGVELLLAGSPDHKSG